MSQMMPGDTSYRIPNHQFYHISNFKDIEKSIIYDACM